VSSAQKPTGARPAHYSGCSVGAVLQLLSRGEGTIEQEARRLTRFFRSERRGVPTARFETSMRRLSTPVVCQRRSQRD
jgi:hypothetical protein